MTKLTQYEAEVLQDLEQGVFVGCMCIGNNNIDELYYTEVHKDDFSDTEEMLDFVEGNHDKYLLDKDGVRPYHTDNKRQVISYYMDKITEILI